jgi:hypothetical protein
MKRNGERHPKSSGSRVSLEEFWTKQSRHSSVKDEEQNQHVISFAEFEGKIEEAQGHLHESFKRISYLFEDFHPRSRPVLWRELLAQAHLYQALICAREESHRPDLWDHVWREDSPNFDWSGATDGSLVETRVEHPIRISAEYASVNTASLLKKLDNEKNEVNA